MPPPELAARATPANDDPVDLALERIRSALRGLAFGTIHVGTSHVGLHGNRRWRYATCMTSRARKLYEEALGLPAIERAELAADLLATLDGDPETDAEAAWTTEVERRAREAAAHPEDDVAWESVRSELQAGVPGE